MRLSPTLKVAARMPPAKQLNAALEFMSNRSSQLALFGSPLTPAGNRPAISVRVGKLTLSVIVIIIQVIGVVMTPAPLAARAA